jgi:hypothetical protein
MPWFSGRIAGWMSLGALAGTLALAVPTARAQEAGLVPEWGGGTLTVRGSGFKAGERVTLTASVGQTQRVFTVTADGGGRFRLPTGMKVPAGQAVKLDARGDQGTGMAAITGTSNLPPEPGGPPGDAGAPVHGEADESAGTQRRGTTALLVGGGAAVLSLLAWAVIRQRTLRGNSRSHN